MSKINQSKKRRKFADLIISLIPIRGLRDFLKKLRLGYTLTTYPNSYLVTCGFVESKLNKSLINKNGDSVPWTCYPLIDLLEERLKKEHSVFEYGSGASTSFFSRIAADIISIEYDKVWYDKIKVLVENFQNAKVHLVELEDNYPSSISYLAKNKKYHLVFVDGRKRVKCCKESLSYLTNDGVIILDDSYRDYYKPAFDFLKENGFRQMTFRGIKPTGFGCTQSTLFYRSNNCFSI